MFNYQKPLAVTLKQFRIQPPLCEFDVKMIQRRIYLLQSVGYPLKYGFYWSFTAPYSDDLMEDVIDIIHCLDSCKEVLTEPAEDVIKLLIELEDKCEKYDRLKLDWVSRLVSVAYGNDVDEDAKKEYKAFKKKAKKILQELNI